MANGHRQHPYGLLREIDLRFKQRAAPLPQREERRNLWTGIDFRLGHGRFLVPLAEVTEILTYPILSLTRVPGAKLWVTGIANVRGNLLPIIDLRDYLGWEKGVVGPNSRVLVIGQQSSLTGLLVDEVLGLKHIAEDRWIANMAAEDAALALYLRGSFIDPPHRWSVFSAQSLIEDPRFLQVAM